MRLDSTPSEKASEFDVFNVRFNETYTAKWTDTVVVEHLLKDVRLATATSDEAPENLMHLLHGHRSCNLCSCYDS